MLPWNYWISLSLLLFTFGVRLLCIKDAPETLKVDVALILMFVLLLFGTPCFVEENARMLDVYGHLSNGLLVKSTGNAGPTLLNYGVSEDSYPVNYPGFFIFSAILLSLSGIPWSIILRLYPIFLMSVISLFIYIIAKKFSKRFCITAPVMFLSMAWFQSFHFSPESVGLILYVTLWFILTNFFVGVEESAKAHCGLSILIAASLVISHPASSIFFIINMSLLSTLVYIQKFVTVSNKLKKIIVNVFATTVILYFAWLTFSAQFSFTSLVNELLKSFENVLSGTSPSLKPENWNYAYKIVNNLREVEVILENMLGIFCILLSFKDKLNRETAIFLGCWLLSSWLFAGYSLFSSGRYIERAALYASFPISISAVSYLSHVKRNLHEKTSVSILIILIVFGCLFLPITRNANDAFESPPTSSLSSFNFATLNAGKSVAYAAPNTAVVALYSRLNSKRIDYYYLLSKKILVEKSDLLLFDELAYACALNYGYELRYIKTKNFADLILPRIYDSQSSQIYFNEFLLLNLTRHIQN
jgi:hypothetical protein